MEGHEEGTSSHLHLQLFSLLSLGVDGAAPGGDVNARRTWVRQINGVRVGLAVRSHKRRKHYGFEVSTNVKHRAVAIQGYVL